MKEIQMKTTIRYPFKPIILVKLSVTISYVGEDVGEGE